MNAPSPRSGELSSISAQIESKTRGEIEVFLASLGRSDIYEGMRNLSQNVSDDYGDRFLVELIQNAHDAHDERRTDGEISILLDESEEAYGCLYVANRGRGFDDANFRSICNIALSSKPINEGIGNKGLGFRSVLQICQRPEIYSKWSDDSLAEFDGYCFRFATESDLRDVLRSLGSESALDAVWQKMPRLFLPVVATERPRHVQQFGRDEFVTVVRLPLDSSAAQDAVVEQFDWIGSLSVPLQLFLERLSRIRLRRISTGFDRTLDRAVQTHTRLTERTSVRRVLVGSETYLVGDYEIPEEPFRRQLEQSVTKRELPESWLRWKGLPRVSVAVRMSQPVVNGRLYCFLPLGEEGKSPFSGHLNANFYTQMDRRSIHLRCGLNEHFISCAAQLCLELIAHLVSGKSEEAPGAVADLLCWSGDHAFKIRGLLAKPKVLERVFLPTLSVTEGFQWSEVASSHFWVSADFECLTAEALVSDANAQIVLPALGNFRLKLLREFFRPTQISLDVGPEVVATWAERIAARMHERQAGAAAWGGFYSDLARLFWNEPKPLFGRNILLCGDNTLRSSEGIIEGRRSPRGAADVYFQPIQGQDSGSDGEDDSVLSAPLPSVLQPRFNFVHQDLQWIDSDRKQTVARQFLARHRFVREYDSRELLRTLAELSRDVEATDEAKRTAIEWAFRIWSSGRSIADKEMLAVRLSVPVRGGWSAASDAMFGEGWSIRNGRALEKLFRDGREFSDELREGRNRLLPHFKDWGFSLGTEAEWVRFLHAAGVRDAIRPISRGRLLGTCQGASLAYAVTSSPEVGKGLVGWKAVIVSLGSRIPNPYTDYRYEGDIWLIPGQEESARLPNNVRRDYALQVVRALKSMPEGVWTFRVFRPRPTLRNEQIWLTPLAHFLISGDWLPTGRGGLPPWRFVPPSGASLFRADPGSPNPRFLDLVDPHCAEECEDEEVLSLLKSRFGLVALTDSESAPRLVELLGDVAAEDILEERDFNRYRELFADAWNTCIRQPMDMAPRYFPMLCNGAIEPMPVQAGSVDESSDAPASSYFADEDNPVKMLLLAGIGRPIFDFDTEDKEKSWAFLSKTLGDRIMKVSEVSLEVLCDGQPLLPNESTPLLSDHFGTWVIEYLVMAAENKGGAFFRKTQKNLADLKRRLTRLRLTVCAEISVQVDGHVQHLPTNMGGRMVLDDPIYPTLVVQQVRFEPLGDLFCRIGEAVAQAIKQRQLASAFEAAALQLTRVFQPTSEARPSDEDMAVALGTTVERIATTRREASDDPIHLLSLLRVVAVALQIADPVEDHGLVGTSDVSESQLNDCLAPVATALKRSVPELVSDLRSVVEPRDFLGERFGLSLVDLNRAIRAVGDGYTLVSNEESHRQCFKGFLMAHSSWIVDQLRTRYLDAFDRQESLASYVAVREFNGLEPNTGWFEMLDDLPEDVMWSHVRQWLASVGISPDAEPRTLRPLEELRGANRESLRKFAERYGPLAPTWASKNRSPLASNSFWLQSGGAKQGLLSVAMQGGWIDFREVGDSEIAAWLGKSGNWPAGMPVSTDFSALGLSAADLGAAEAKARTEQEERRQRRLQIAFDGKEMSALELDYQELVSALRGAIAKVADKLGSGADVPLEDMSLRPRKGSGGKRGGDGKAKEPSDPDSTLSDEQRKAVGLVGELWAFEWIKAFHHAEHGIDVTADAWVSSYRGRALGLPTSEDADKKGFDFKVDLKQVSYYYEVKASSGDPELIELGPTEIAAALRYRRDAKDKYRILYVANALNPAAIRFTVLQNPYSSKGEKQFWIVGGGSVKYRFHRIEANDEA